QDVRVISMRRLARFFSGWVNRRSCLSLCSQCSLWFTEWRASRARLLPDRTERVGEVLDAGRFLDDALDACVMRALGEEVAEACDGIGVACHLGFHRAVGAVADPAAQFELLRLADRPRPEADAL